MFVNSNLAHWKYKLLPTWNLQEIQLFNDLFLIIIQWNLV